MCLFALNSLSCFLLETLCVFRAEGGGGEATISPDELPGHPTREGQVVPAGDHWPQEQTLSARERNG